jgi:hypothetical protein
MAELLNLGSLFEEASCTSTFSAAAMVCHGMLAVKHSTAGGDGGRSWQGLLVAAPCAFHMIG